MAIEPSWSVYFGTESEETLLSFVAENNFFAVLNSTGEVAKEEGKNFLKKLSDDLNENPPATLAEFEQRLSAHWKEIDLPATSSLSALLRNQDKCIIKTIGKGEIYLKRGGDFAKIIHGDKAASGYATTDDFFILTVAGFAQLAGSESKIVRYIDRKTPAEARESLIPVLKAGDDSSVIALFLSFANKDIPLTQSEESQEQAPPPVNEEVFKTNKVMDYISKFQGWLTTLDRRRTLTLAAVVLIFMIFLWSIVFGYQRRSQQNINTKIKSQKELIEANLAQAEEVAFLNTGRANALIAEARRNLESLKKEVGNRNTRAITSLEELIDEKESQIFKKEEKTVEEFFDLTIEAKNAKGNLICLSDDNLTVVDKVAGAAYTVSISKKSLERITASELKRAIGCGSYETTAYFLTDSAVYQVSDGKTKKAIENKGWGRVAALAVYNGNIYLLDPSKNQIYRYNATDGGFAEKADYIKSGQELSLQGAVSLAIDSSIYIGFSDRLMKFTSGLRDGFKTTLPNEDASISKIVTNTDLEKIYAWDKANGAIYILNKTGSYERQVQAKILKEAADFEVFDGNAYILSASKIYRINFD